MGVIQRVDVSEMKLNNLPEVKLVAVKHQNTSYWVASYRGLRNIRSVHDFPYTDAGKSDAIQHLIDANNKRAVK